MHIGTDVLLIFFKFEVLFGSIDVYYELLLSFSFFRMLVYEYVNNGNLDQWLHGDVGDVSPLTWEIRVNIILGTAKGCVIVLLQTSY